VPKHGFKSLSVSERVYEKLREIAERRGFATLSDTVAYLVTLEEEVYRRIEQLVTSSSGNVTSSSGNVTSSSGNVTSSSGNIGTYKDSSKPKKETSLLSYRRAQDANRLDRSQ